MKDRSEIFRVVQLNLNEHTADVLGLETDIVERGVHWTMLKAVGNGPLDDAQGYWG
jgi:hypothetical protein